MLTVKTVNHINALYLSASAERDRNSLLVMHGFRPVKAYFKLAIHTIGGNSISAAGVVVVETAVSIHITHIVRVTNIRRTQPPIPRRHTVAIPW